MNRDMPLIHVSKTDKLSLKFCLVGCQQPQKRGWKGVREGQQEREGGGEEGETETETDVGGIYHGPSQEDSENIVEGRVERV